MIFFLAELSQPNRMAERIVFRLLILLHSEVKTLTCIRIQQTWDLCKWSFNIYPISPGTQSTLKR
jgi:hypothetical protein